MKEFQDYTFLSTRKNIFPVIQKKGQFHLACFHQIQLSKSNNFIPFQLCVKSPQNNLKTSHYKTTPYAFNPRFAKKIVPESFIDLGQGLLQIVEHINEELNIKRQS